MFRPGLPEQNQRKNVGILAATVARAVYHSVQEHHGKIGGYFLCCF